MLDVLFGKKKNVRALIVYLRIADVLLLFGGIYLAFQTGNEHWVNRSGAIIVVSSLVLTFAQFRYEGNMGRMLLGQREVAKRRLENKVLPEYKIREIIEERQKEAEENFEQMRHSILLNALLIAAAGEFIHGFGDLIFSLAICLHPLS